ncbi:GntR family transcriptional regulator [Leifsonia sp. AG29]|uniref:GntR family transcriptional regulator n=1 Tax=Leifsonia sp. AG29 TaxID=2598860 RepID=UPI00131DA37F|nr:GntR family transcriptional regulator [Leifsonia sp. AG29]
MRASDLAYEGLRQDIIDWVLPPGSTLGEIETAERYRVSRTPVREALARLAAEGLVSTSGRTAIVTSLTRKDVLELFELREALETQAARLAARRRSPERFAELLEEFRRGPSSEGDADPRRPYFLASELDVAIDAACQSRYLQSALEDIRGQIARVRFHARSNPHREERAIEEHIQIVEAILSGDEMFASQVTAVHLRNSLANVLDSLPL